MTNCPIEIGFFGVDNTKPERALEVGKAAEHIVCADLILQGYRAYLSDQGLPYDVVVDLGGKLIRVQVKATTALRVVPQRKAEHHKYMWHVRRGGKRFARVIGNDEFEILALVALDIKTVAYIRICDKVRQSVHLGAPGTIHNTRDRRTVNKNVDEYPFCSSISDLICPQ